MNQGQQCHITKSIDEQSKRISLLKAKYERFFSYQHIFFQLLVLSSNSPVTILFSLKAKRQSPTVTTSSHHLLHRCMLTPELHLPPQEQSSLDKPMLLLPYLLYLQFLAHRLHLSLAAAAMSTTKLQLPHQPSGLLFILPPLLHQVYIHQQWRCMRLPNLFLRRALILTLPRIAGPHPRGVNLGWITIVITAGYLISHITITISTTTINEFPATFKSMMFCVGCCQCLLLHIFFSGPLVLVILFDQIWNMNSRVPYFFFFLCRFPKVVLEIEFVECI